MPIVSLPSSLRRYTDQQARLSVEGATVSDVLRNLIATAPPMRSHLFAADQLRSFVVVSKNGQDVRQLQGLETPVAAQDEIRILSSIAGG